MDAKIKLTTALLVGLAFSSEFVAAARADTMSFAIGIESNFGIIDQAHTWSTTSGAVGLKRGANVTCHYYMPLYWRTFTGAGVNRTVRLRARVPTSSDTLGCTVFIYDNQANVLAQSAAQLMPVTGTAYATQDMVVNHVPSGAHGIVACTIEGNALALNISWTP